MSVDNNGLLTWTKTYNNDKEQILSLQNISRFKTLQFLTWQIQTELKSEHFILIFISPPPHIKQIPSQQGIINLTSVGNSEPFSFSGFPQRAFLAHFIGLI